MFDPCYDSADFTYNRELRTMTAEASTIGYSLVVPTLRIQSKISGMVVRFERYKTDYDQSGEDVAGWRYRPSAEDARFPHIKGLEVLIIND